MSEANLAAFREALEQSLIMNMKEGDLLVFDNEQYMHARPPYTGPRKLVCSSLTSLSHSLRVLVCCTFLIVVLPESLSFLK